MSREKQIEEIVNILWNIPNNYSLNSYNDCERIAECIYDDGGYRKQSEVVKEIFEEINNMPHHLMNSPYALALIKELTEYGTINISSWQLDQIAKEMLEENNGIH